MDRQKKIPSPSMKITRKLAQQSKGHSNLMNYYSKLSRDKSGAPVRWKMSQPIHVDEAAISGRCSPARASSSTAAGSRSVSRESDGKRKGETDKLGKKVAERSKSRDSSAGSKSRKNSIERKSESETKAIDNENEAKSHVSRKSLKKNQEDVSTKQSRGKRISLSSVSTATHIPERMKPRPHSLDLNYNRNADLNGEDETFKSPELSPCTEVVKRKKGRPKQTPPTLEIERFIPTNSECKNAEDAYSEENLSSITPDVPFISQSNNHQLIADADLANSAERSSVGVIDQSGNKKVSRPRGRPPKLKVSLMDIVHAKDSQSICKLKKHLYMDESRPSSSKNSSTIRSDVSFISQSNSHRLIADADLASSAERSSVGVIDPSGSKPMPRPRGRPPKKKVSLIDIFHAKDSQYIGKQYIEKHLYVEESRPSAPKYKSLLCKTKQANLKINKVGKYGKISKSKDDKASKLHSTVVSGKVLIETSVDQVPDESAVIVDSATVNGDMDDPEITFKQRSMDSNIKTPSTQFDVKKTRTVKKDLLKKKAENSVTKFKQGVESAPKIKKKRIIMSHAIKTDAVDTLTHLASNDLRRKIHRNLINKLNGGRKEAKMIKYESKESKTDEAMEENKLIDSSTETDTNEYIQEFQRVKMDDNIHDIGNELSKKRETVSQVDILSAIIEQKRLLSRENSQPDRLKRKTQEHVRLIPSENETEKEIADIGKQSDSESVCSELSVQSTLSRHTDCKRKITTLVKTSDDEPHVRTRQRCEILPPGGNTRKRTLSGEFHLLDEVKLRKNQRNSDISEKKDEGSRTDPLTERKLPISSTQFYVKNTSKATSKAVKIMRKSKMHVHVKDKRIPAHRKEILNKSRILLNKTFSQPVQKRKLLPQHKKVKKVVSKKIRQCAVVYTGDQVHDSNKCNLVNVPASESFCSESKEVVKTDVTKDEAVSAFDNLRATDEIAEPLSKIGDESENLNLIVKGEIDCNETAILPLDTKLESDELCTSDESVSTSGLLTSTAMEVTEEANVVKQEVDNDITNAIPLNDNSSTAMEVTEKANVVKQEVDNDITNAIPLNDNSSTAMEVTEEANVVKQEVDNDITNAIPLNDNSSTAMEVTAEANVVKQEVDSDITNAIPLNDNFAEHDEQKNRLDDNECDAIQTNKIDNICMLRNSDYSEMKEIGENCTEQEAYSNNIDSTLQSDEHVAVSKITEIGATVIKEQIVPSNTDVVESIENTDASIQSSTDSVTNDELKCFIKPKITEDSRLEATLSFPSEKVVKDDTCFNTEKERSDMQKIAFVVNEVVQGILYSVEHTLEELENVHRLDKLEITTDKLLENNPDIDIAGNDKESEVNDLTSVSDSMININNIITGNTCNHATIETGLEVAITEEEMFNSTTVIKKDEYSEHSIDEVDTGSDKKDTDLIQQSDDLTNIQSSNTEELLHDGTTMSDCKVSPESKEVSSIVGKTQRKRNYSKKGSKELNIVGRKIELRQKISRSPLDNIALKHSIEENEYYKNEALKANRREAKLKSKTAALHAKESDAVTNSNAPILDNAKPNIDHTDNELVPQDIYTESEMSDIVSDNEIQTQTTCTLTADDLLKHCKPCSVLLIDFIKQLQINQQKRSETGSESETLENEKSTDVDNKNSYMKETNHDEHDSVSKGQFLNKTPKTAQISQEALENKLISSFGNLETESGEQTARKTVPPLKIKLKGGVRRKTYMVESTIQPEAEKTVTENNKKSKGKSSSLKSDSDSDKQKVHHHKKRNKVLPLEHEPQRNVQSPSKPSLHPPVIPKDAYEANFLKFIKDKELLENDGIPKLASAPVSAKSVNQTADGKVYKVQENGSLTVSASGDAATSTCTSKSDTGLNEAAIVAQKKKAENAGQIMESYAKFREKIMKESVGRKTTTDSKELEESNAEIVECNKNILSTVSCKNNYIRANDNPGNVTEVNTEGLTDISVNAENQKMDSADDLIRFICNHCVFSSDTKFEMVEHTKLNHANDVKYICPLCEKVYVEKEAILHHCETSHIGQEVMYSLLPDFRDWKSEMDKIPEKERESANHGNIFDRIHTLMQSNDSNSSNQQGDINSLQTHYLKTSAEADSTTGVPSDKLAKSDNSSTEAKKISEASDTAVEEPDDDEEMDIQIVDVVSLKNQPDMAVPPVPVAESSVSGVGSIAPQTELKIPTFIPRDVPPQPQMSAVNQMKSAQPVKDYNVPKKSSGRLGNTFKCEKCNVHAPLLGAMVAHLRNVHRDIPRLFQCPYCRDLEAETEAKIHHHIRLFHPTDNPNPPVALSEPAKSNLKTLSIPLPENRFTDNNLVEKDIYMCLKCKTHMPTHETIYDHLEAEHIEVFVSVCPFCKTFKSKDENRVNEHIVTAHQRSYDELPLSLAIDGNQFVRVPSLIKEKNKNSNKSHSQQPQTAKGVLPQHNSNVMSLTQKNLQQHQLLQQRQMLGKQVPRMPTNPELARMMSQMNHPQYTSPVDQTLLKRPVQRHLLPQTIVQSAAQQNTVSSQQQNSHHQPVQGAKKRKLNLSDTIANLTIQKQAEQNALMNITAVASTATGSPLPTYAQSVQLQNQTQQLHQQAHGLPPPLLRGPPPLIRFDQLIGVADGSVNNSQSSNKPSTQNPVSQRLATGLALGVSPQPSAAAKPIQSALFDTTGQSSFGSVSRKPVLNVPLVPRSGNRHTPKSSAMTATGSPLDLSSKSTPSNSPAQTPSPSPNVATENPEAFKIFNLKPIAPQPAPQGQQLPFQQFVQQVRPNTSNTLAYRPTTPHVPNSSQSQQVMSMPLNAALLGGNVIVSIPNIQPNLPTVQLQTLQQLVRLGAPVQTGMAQLQNLQPLVRIAAPGQPPTTSIQQALQSPRGLAVGQVSPGVQQMNLQQLPSPTPSPQQINANLNLPMFKCPYCPKLTKLAPAEVQAHIEALHPGSSVMFKQCDT